MAADEPEEPVAGFEHLAVGIGVGPLFPGPGQLNLGGAKFRTGPGATVPFFLDAMLIRQLSMGVFFNYSYMPDENATRAANVLSTGLTIKGRFSIGEVFQLRPGLAFGYNRIMHESWANDSNGMDLALIVESAFTVHENVGPFVQFSFISQPVGGTGDFSVGFPPIMYLAAGCEFGL